MGTLHFTTLTLLSWMALSGELTAAQMSINIIQPTEKTLLISGIASTHNELVCSTWGDFHFLTFDGDHFQLPSTCNHILTSQCGGSYEEFNVQMRRKVVNGEPIISAIFLKLDGTLVELSKGSIRVNGKTVTAPFVSSGIYIEMLSSYISVKSTVGLTALWNEDDAFMVELNAKFKNHTCGLCGDFNGIPSFNEMIKNDVLLSPSDYGTLWKMDGPTEQCEDIPALERTNCGDENFCRQLFLKPEFSSCTSLVTVDLFVNACMKDLCQCNTTTDFSCLCKTIAEYSRQCVHAGGKPENWRTEVFCPKSCLDTLQYSECGSPCVDTCSNSELGEVCGQHCIDGCFCPSVLGGSHIITFDTKPYTFNGECSYVLAKECTGNDFVILGDLLQCGLSSTESCLKSITLVLGSKVIQVDSSGNVNVDRIYTQLPLFTAELSIYKPSSFYIAIRVINSKLLLQIQLVPIMQVFITLAPVFQGQTCGLCGNFNNIQADDFTTPSKLTEGTAVDFANSWKTRANCLDVQRTFENPCSLSTENEKYAQHWCSLLSDPSGVFARCHSEISPKTYKENCIYDTCNCQQSEDCMCAALSSYAHSCAAKGIVLSGWRDATCGNYTLCPSSLVFSYEMTSCERTCRFLGQEDYTCTNPVKVEGCGCAPGTYMNEIGVCVTANDCPCYDSNTIIQPGEVISKDGTTCTCKQGKLSCFGGMKVEECVAPMTFFNCSSAAPGSPGSECQKSCQILDMACISTECVSGCMCPSGLVSDGNSGCITEDLCPCVHNGVNYRSGESIQDGCNTCTCKERRWQCTTNPCRGTCSIYGDGHYTTFDEKRYEFNGNCEYSLAQDFCSSSSTNGTFRVITENIPCGTGGTTCSKAIKLFIGSNELILSDGTYQVVQRSNREEIPYQIRTMGNYLVVETYNGVMLVWDRKTTIYIVLNPQFNGNVCGLCGNFDGNANNDFTTRSQEVVIDPASFGNSWKVSPTCPEAFAVSNPCAKNPYREAWAQKQCSIITSVTFAACHSQVEPSHYYSACVSDACACDSGGDCECFCTAVAAYAKACSAAGVCVSWRSPKICPLFCDYYNPPGECEWHYKPCGHTCLKTCRNPTGNCTLETPALEGCYPECPEDLPYFDEDMMKCVAKNQCGCYAEMLRYEIGQSLPAKNNCQTCECTNNGESCKYDVNACTCKHNDTIYKYGDIIYYTTDGLGNCISAICAEDGQINKTVEPCKTTVPPTVSTTPLTTTPMPTTVFVFTTPVSPKTTTVPHKITTTQPLETTPAKETTVIPEKTTLPITTPSITTTIAPEKTTTRPSIETTIPPEITTLTTKPVIKATTVAPEVTTTLGTTTPHKKTTTPVETTPLTTTVFPKTTTVAPEITTTQSLETTPAKETTVIPEKTTLPITTPSITTTVAPEKTTTRPSIETTIPPEITTLTTKPVIKATTVAPEVTTTLGTTTPPKKTTTPVETTPLTTTVSPKTTTVAPEITTTQSLETTPAKETTVIPEKTTLPITTPSITTTVAPEKTTTRPSIETTIPPEITTLTTKPVIKATTVAPEVTTTLGTTTPPKKTTTPVETTPLTTTVFPKTTTVAPEITTTRSLETTPAKETTVIPEKTTLPITTPSITTTIAPEVTTTRPSIETTIPPEITTLTTKPVIKATTVAPEVTTTLGTTTPHKKTTTPVETTPLTTTVSPKTTTVPHKITTTQPLETTPAKETTVIPEKTTLPITTPSITTTVAPEKTTTRPSIETTIPPEITTLTTKPVIKATTVAPEVTTTLGTTTPPKKTTTPTTTLSTTTPHKKTTTPVETTPFTTTVFPKTTTVAPEITTTQSLETTPAKETTVIPEKTTLPITTPSITTTIAPEVTTTRPSIETTIPPEITTLTTKPVIKATTVAPEVTTTLGTTTPHKKTTTPVERTPLTTTVFPKTTTVAPEITTTQSLETSTGMTKTTQISVTTGTTAIAPITKTSNPLTGTISTTATSLKTMSPFIPTVQPTSVSPKITTLPGTSSPFITSTAPEFTSTQPFTTTTISSEITTLTSVPTTVVNTATPTTKFEIVTGPKPTSLGPTTGMQKNVSTTVTLHVTTAPHCCLVNGTNYPSDTIIYNVTDGFGWCFIAHCNATCDVEIKSYSCSTTPPPVTTIPFSTTALKTTSAVATTVSTQAPLSTTVTPDCTSLDPPRKDGETWKADNCNTATCSNGTVIYQPLHQCPPVKQITCTNGRTPVKVYDETGCCFKYECECFCSGWGDSHYVTFDGTAYSLNDNCSYILVQDTSNPNLKIVLDKEACSAGSSFCPQSLTITFNSQEIILTQTMTSNGPTNVVMVNHKRIYPVFKNANYIITSTGMEVTVSIPEIQAQVTYTGTSFSIYLPFSQFQNKTEGLCGPCDNDQTNDCRNPSGQIESCDSMAQKWQDPEKTCMTPSIPPPPPIIHTTIVPSTTSTTCQPVICELFNSRVFEECSGIISPEPYLTSCKKDVCSEKPGCTSLQAYALACSKAGVCINWRNYTNGECACVGPDGSPKMPNETWQIGCQNCECDSESMSVHCNPVVCPTTVVPTCDGAGYERVNKTDGCCESYECQCNPSQCVTPTMACPLGFWQEMEPVQSGQCCPTYTCKPMKVCVQNGTVYQPGSPMPSDDLCKECECGSDVDNKTELLTPTCTIKDCMTKCDEGYEYQLVPGKCCGECVKTSCVVTINNVNKIIPMNETFTSPDDKCVKYTCQDVNGDPTVKESRKLCPEFNPATCVPGSETTDADGCCMSCTPKDTCDLHSNTTVLVHGECKSTTPVEITSCSGSCGTSSMYSAESNTLIHKCTCCYEMQTSMKQVEMICADGSKSTFTYIYIESCGCKVSECTGVKRRRRSLNSERS
ncbi:Mucin-5B [Bagarius yarrelli]|uniref:Mucin-5B n=1 Tax=Bagarius yarrelli TaxID=175774 RepID=A0A556U329_BAGYA|nr:Mucin-5B [Bagarius yarrelli]